MFQIKSILRLLPLSAIMFASLASCKKKTTDTTCTESLMTASASDSVALRNYIESDTTINAVYDSRGFYYEIIKPGDDNKPTQCSTITASYYGKLTNGYQFDSNNSASLGMSYNIAGFRMAVPFIGVGGEIKFYLPPSLAYGNDDNGTIPGGSILIFDVKLLAITKK